MRSSLRTAPWSFLCVPSASERRAREEGPQDMFVVGAVLLLFLTQLSMQGGQAVPLACTRQLRQVCAAVPQRWGATI